MVRMFNAHGTYINDYPGFDIVKKLGIKEAFALLSKSEWIEGDKPKVPDDKGEFLLNKAWAVVNVDRELGYVDVVYNYDGKFSLRRAGIQTFLNRIYSSVSWNRTLNSLYEKMAEPNENA